MAWNPTLQRTESQLSGRASESEGHRFDSCLESSDFFSSMPVSVTENRHLSFIDRLA